MLRVTIEMLPMGNEARAKTIGLVEIANAGPDPDKPGHFLYQTTLTKTPPFRGALKAAWKRGGLPVDEETDLGDVLAGRVSGFHRTKRGTYDLLYLCLKACGLDRRNP